MSDQAETKTTEAPADPNARLRANADRFGPGYALFAEALKGDGIDNVVKWVWRGLGAFAAFVILYAIISS
ncbi:MAG: hypothetical protein EA355_07155 [Rhodobacteraceae bacterium]|nr:MAG: hypothetical protein EA355_07155 [Paracoccaceae bacterium]